MYLCFIILMNYIVCQYVTISPFPISMSLAINFTLSNVNYLIMTVPCVCVLSQSVVSSSLQPQGLESTRLLCPWNISGKQEYWSGLPFPSPMHEVQRESEIAQSCLTLNNPMDCSLPGSSVHRILQARVLEWVAISSSRGYSRPRD